MAALRRLLPRFSLRTLALFMLLVTSGMGLWWHWGPWYCERTLTSHGKTIRTVFFTPDGTRVMVCSTDGKAHVWEVATGKCVQFLESYEGPDHAALSPDGQRLVSAGRIGTFGIYRRRRPEWWWGIFWLKEFWLTVVFAGVFVWSVVRDRQLLARASERTGQ